MAGALAKLVPSLGTVPDSIRARYVKGLSLCKLTNGNGVAWSAEPIYDRLIRTWQDKEILTFLSVLVDADIRSKLQFKLCSTKLHEVATILSSRTSNALALKGPNFIKSYKPEVAGGAVSDNRLTAVAKQVKGGP